MTAPTPPPFATPGEIAAVWRPLSDIEQAYAGLLVAAAAAWIRSKRPDIAADDPAAKFVTIEAVKAVLKTGEWQGYRSWTRTLDDATIAAVMANPEGTLDFTDLHYDMLRIARNPLPVGHFQRDDFGPTL